MRKIKFRNAAQVESYKSQDSNPNWMDFKISVLLQTNYWSIRNPLITQIKKGTQTKQGNLVSWRRTTAGNRLQAIHFDHVLKENGFFKNTMVVFYICENDKYSGVKICKV